MKARIQKPQPIFLYYALDGDKKDGILKLLDEFNIRSREIKDSETCEQIGFLAGWSGLEQNKNGSILNENQKEECIIFCGIENKTLNQLVSLMRSRGLAVDLKAVATPFNQSWSFCDLLDELKQEHQKMHGIK